jgi:hypothetical protein
METTSVAPRVRLIVGDIGVKYSTVGASVLKERSLLSIGENGVDDCGFKASNNVLLLITGVTLLLKCEFSEPPDDAVDPDQGLGKLNLIGTNPSSLTSRGDKSSSAPSNVETLESEDSHGSGKKKKGL